MAFEAKKINPLDLQPRKAIGVSLPFTGLGVFNSTFATKDAIKNNLINFFLTGKGERFLNPAFGTGLRNLLFENISKQNLDAIDGEVKESLRNYFPQVIPIKINTQGEPDRNSVTFSMRYQIQDTGIEDTVAINFELE
jgi:phage baseplate assembly protein W